MIVENNQEKLYLVNRLIRLLRNLNFADIQVKSHSDFPNPRVEQFINTEINFEPTLLARKNDVIYFFEFVNGSMPELLDSKRSIQEIIAIGDQRWDTEFVLVTSYGNKDTVKEWCHNNHLPVDQIWEV